MRLWLVRHAETALAGSFCGSSDPELNGAGGAQVARLVERLAGERMDAVYSSDLRRARQTAEGIAAARGLSVGVWPGLREVDFGAWEGLRWSEIEGLDRAYAERWVREFPGLAAPGGEEFGEFRRRVLGEFGRLCAGAWGEGWESVAVVTHGGVLRVLLEECAGCSGDEAWVRTREYTGVTKCVQDGPLGELRITG